MTPQVRDTFQYEGDRYFAVAGNSFVGFQPSDYGICPAPRNTACWDGYWCEYQISEKGIILQNLYINAKDDYYPEINHVSPLKDGKMGHHFYKNINIRIEYTGKILMGESFSEMQYVFMGYMGNHWSMSYKLLKELIFDHGKLVTTVDHSEEAKKLELRTEIRIPDKPDENTETSGILLLEKDTSQGIEELLQCLENRRKLNETKQENFLKRFLAKIRRIFKKLSQSR